MTKQQKLLAFYDKHDIKSTILRRIKLTLYRLKFWYIGERQLLQEKYLGHLLTILRHDKVRCAFPTAFQRPNFFKTSFILQRTFFSEIEVRFLK